MILVWEPHEPPCGFSKASEVIWQVVLVVCHVIDLQPEIRQTPLITLEKTEIIQSLPL